MNKEIEHWWQLLGISKSGYGHLPLYEEAKDLQEVGPDCFGRPQKLLPSAGQSWQDMVKAAEKDNVCLQMVSCFRSYEYQAGLIQRKLDQGLNITDILKVVVAPGCSEHHTGRAIDINTLGCEAVTESFEKTEAFSWLTEKAEQYGFHMSFPKDNPHGVIYEPWHWTWR